MFVPITFLQSSYSFRLRLRPCLKALKREFATSLFKDLAKKIEPKIPEEFAIVNG